MAEQEGEEEERPGSRGSRMRLARRKLRLTRGRITKMSQVIWSKSYLLLCFLFIFNSYYIGAPAPELLPCCDIPCRVRSDRAGGGALR